MRNKKGERESDKDIQKSKKREARKCGVKAIVRLASQNPDKHPRATLVGIVIENVIGEVRVSTEMPHTPKNRRGKCVLGIKIGIFRSFVAKF